MLRGAAFVLCVMGSSILILTTAVVLGLWVHSWAGSAWALLVGASYGVISASLIGNTMGRTEWWWGD